MSDRKIIAADVGHCECYVTHPSRNESGFEILPYTVGGSKDTIMSSRIFLTDEQMRKLKGKAKPTYNDLQQLGDIIMGNDIPADISNGELFNYFKVPPKDFNKTCGYGKVARECGITHGQIMTCFIYALVEKIFDKNTTNLSPNDRREIYLIIGCPSTNNWKGTEYANLVKRATNIGEVHIVPESRAAMFSCVSNNVNPISAVKGAVVFDFGSSTADCTYMLLGRKKIEFSYTLGAFEIEHNMAMYARNQIRDFEISANSFREAEHTCQKMKEKFYKHEVRNAKKQGEPFNCWFADNSGNGEYQQIWLSENFMRQMTERQNISIRIDSKDFETGPWRALLRKFFQEAKKKIESSKYDVTDLNDNKREEHCTIDTIVLTGGASNMDFVYEECRNVFTEVPEENIILEKNTSYTVGTGLSWVALCDLKEKACIERAIAAVRDVPSCKIEVLRDSISEAIMPKIYEITIGKTQEWAELTYDATLENLKDLVESAVAETDFTALHKTVFDTWGDKFADAVCDAVNEEAKKLFSPEISRGIMLPPELWKQLLPVIKSYGNLDFTRFIDSVDFNGLVKWLLSRIGGVAIFIAKIVVLPFTFLPLIGDIIAEIMEGANDFFWNLFGGKKKITEPCSQNDRQTAADNVKKNVGNWNLKVKEEFDKKLAEQISDEKFVLLVEDTVKLAFQIVTLKKFLY